MKKQKLKLDRTTIQQLSTEEVGVIRGGAKDTTGGDTTFTNTCVKSCWSLVSVC